MNYLSNAKLWACLGLAILLANSATAQTIHIDSTPDHVINSIRPTTALGAGVDRLPADASDKVFNKEIIARLLEAGWQTVTYRQNTELHAEAWHWNPTGMWSAAGHRGYFTGQAEPGKNQIAHSYGFPLPRRGVTHDDGTDATGYSRLTDGDSQSFWKSNPYLTEHFTGEPDAAHPQWVILDLGRKESLNAIRIDWMQPYAKHYLVQFWTGDDPIKKPASGIWQLFAHGNVDSGKGGRELLNLAEIPVQARYVRVLMTESSNSCSTKNSTDVRDCLGYAIGEISLGNADPHHLFSDLVRHSPNQDQTATYCSSIDPWHEEKDLDEHAGDQVGFDRFFNSGITRGLPAMIPIAMLYSTPEDAANELNYLLARKYKISYVEMGEEPDGHYTTPEDYAALYVQFAKALHRVDPTLKLGGPVFTGSIEDILTWPNEAGETSWTRRFIDYLKRHDMLSALSFFSYEHYPVDPGKFSWSNLYDEANLNATMTKIWRQDGVPADVPLFITESNISPVVSDAYMDIWGGLWLADYIGSGLSAGNSAIYYFHYIPLPLEPGSAGSVGTFNFYSLDKDWKIKQPLAQFYASQMINLEWMQPGDGLHQMYAAQSDVIDAAGHTLVTAYPVLRPDGNWSVLIINKDPENEHKVRLAFEDENTQRTAEFTGPVSKSTFGKAQYQWHSNQNGGYANPDNAAIVEKITMRPGEFVTLAPASVTVLRGKN